MSPEQASNFDLEASVDGATQEGRRHRIRVKVDGDNVVTGGFTLSRSGTTLRSACEQFWDSVQKTPSEQKWIAYTHRLRELKLNARILRHLFLAADAWKTPVRLLINPEPSTKNT